MDIMKENCYSSRIEIDLDKIGRNIEKIRAHTGLDIIPVIKSNAYGSGTVGIANYVVRHCDVKLIAVARLFEAMQVIQSGCLEADILILGPLLPDAIPVAAEHGFAFPLFREEDAVLASREAKRLGRQSVKVHLKIETGMNRIGVKPGEALERLLRRVRELGNIEIDGVFTHFASSDEANGGQGNDFTRQQFSVFREGLRQLERAGFWPKYIHCCNTGAAIWMKEAWRYCTHVRTGSLYLGYSYIDHGWNPLGVEESGTWKANIVKINEISPGESAGYSQAFRPETPARVAVIDVGYGDGYLRGLAERHGGVALVNGIRCPFVSICMDMAFLDVTDVDCKVGDEVILYGEDKNGNVLSGLEVGWMMGETRCAMLTHITERVARVYQIGGRQTLYAKEI